MKILLVFLSLALVPALGSVLKLDDQPGIPQLRQQVSNPKKLWPNGTVYYTIDKLSFNATQLSLISKAMSYVSNSTCIKFQLRVAEKNYASIIKPAAGCNSETGMQGGKQTINLATECFQYNSRGYDAAGTLAHELIHCLGFSHENQRSDRDTYVKVNVDNIKPGEVHNFDKKDEKKFKDQPFDYDYGSIMHYRAREAIKSGKEYANKTTLDALVNPSVNQDLMGQRKGLSTTDVKKIDALYKDECAKRSL